MVAASGAFDSETESVAHASKVGFECAAGIGDNQTAKTDAEKNLLHEDAGKSCSCDIGNGANDHKTGQVAHGGEHVFETIFAEYAAGLPNINVNDVERHGNRPGIDKLAVTTDRRAA